MSGRRGVLSPTRPSDAQMKQKQMAEIAAMFKDVLEKSAERQQVYSLYLKSLYLMYLVGR